MPNHCECDLHVTGPKKELKLFQRFAKSKTEEGVLLDENRFIPYPKKFRDMDKKAKEWMEKHPDDWANRPKDGFNSGGYEWCIENWGTKWGLYDVEMTDEGSYGKEAYASYTFRSAWSPPIPVIKAMAKKFPKLQFDLRYFECGMGFNGLLRLADGEVVEEQEAPYFGNRGG